MHKPRFPGHLPCTGCIFAIGHPEDLICSRMPPVWTTPVPVPAPKLALAGVVPSGPQITVGGWQFPPAQVRCGEFVGLGEVAMPVELPPGEVE